MKQNPYELYGEKELGDLSFLKDVRERFVGKKFLEEKLFPGREWSLCFSYKKGDRRSKQQFKKKLKNEVLQKIKKKPSEIRNSKLLEYYEKYQKGLTIDDKISEKKEEEEIPGEQEEEQIEEKKKEPRKLTLSDVEELSFKSLRINPVIDNFPSFEKIKKEWTPLYDSKKGNNSEVLINIYKGSWKQRVVVVKFISKLEKGPFTKRHIKSQVIFPCMLSSIYCLNNIGYVVYEEDLDNAKKLGVVVENMGTSLEDLIVDCKLCELHKRYLTKRIIHCYYYLHKNRVVHADAKAGNILVTRDLKFVKVCDFETSQWLKKNKTLKERKRRGLQGTPGYLAPECSVNNILSADFCADCFSVGVTLFKLWVKKMPTDIDTGDKNVKLPVYIEFLKKMYYAEGHEKKREEFWGKKEIIKEIPKDVLELIKGLMAPLESRWTMEKAMFEGQKKIWKNSILKGLKDESVFDEKLFNK